MINSTYAKAYREVMEIIKYFPKKEYIKIPKEKIEFYKNNMDTNYNFTINPEIDLSKQNISPEANAIIINLFTEYYATAEQKIKIKEILYLNRKKKEEEKREKYKPNEIFQKVEKTQNTEIKPTEANKNTALVEHKVQFWTKIKNFIFKTLNIKK